ncbi:MAG TPA: ABC transporter permease subunit, partial [bacterium]|nr:ABC transporter permease subunit [bacterium]
RVIRSQILSLREREFTYTARLSGMKTSSIILKEYLPFIVPLIMATAMNNMLWAIGMEVTLAILGLSSLEIPTLGTMIHWSVNSQSLLLGIWWWILTPVIICIFLFISLYMLSVSISEFLDPRSRLKRIEVMKE